MTEDETLISILRTMDELSRRVAALERIVLADGSQHVARKTYEFLRKSREILDRMETEVGPDNDRR